MSIPQSKLNWNDLTPVDTEAGEALVNASKARLDSAVGTFKAVKGQALPSGEKATKLTWDDLSPVGGLEMGKVGNLTGATVPQPGSTPPAVKGVAVGGAKKMPVVRQAPFAAGKLPAMGGEAATAPGVAPVAPLETQRFLNAANAIPSRPESPQPIRSMRLDDKPLDLTLTGAGGQVSRAPTSEQIEQTAQRQAQADHEAAVRAAASAQKAQADRLNAALDVVQGPVGGLQRRAGLSIGSGALETLAGIGGGLERVAHSQALAPIESAVRDVTGNHEPSAISEAASKLIQQSRELQEEYGLGGFGGEFLHSAGGLAPKMLAPGGALAFGATEYLDAKGHGASEGEAVKAGLSAAATAKLAGAGSEAATNVPARFAANLAAPVVVNAAQGNAPTVTPHDLAMAAGFTAMGGGRPEEISITAAPPRLVKNERSTPIRQAQAEGAAGRIANEKSLPVEPQAPITSVEQSGNPRPVLMPPLVKRGEENELLRSVEQQAGDVSARTGSVVSEPANNGSQLRPETRPSDILDAERQRVASVESRAQPMGESPVSVPPPRVHPPDVAAALERVKASEPVVPTAELPTPDIELPTQQASPLPPAVDATNLQQVSGRPEVVEHHSQAQPRDTDGTFNGPPSKAYTPKAERERSLPKTLDEAKFPKGENLTYTPVSNPDALASADSIIEQKGLNGAAEWVKGENEPSAQHTATALKVISELQKTGRHDEAVDVASDLADKLTRHGQAIQAVKVINQLSPERALLVAERIAKKYKTRVNAKAISEKAERAQADDSRLSFLEREVERLTKEVQAKGSKKTAPKGLTGRLSDRATTALARLEGRVPDLSNLARPSERGAVRVGKPPLQGDAEFLAEYGASTLSKSMDEWKADMRSRFGDISDSALSTIARRAYEIRGEERVSDLAERMANPETRRSAGAEIAQSIRDADASAKKAEQERAMWEREERRGARERKIAIERAALSNEERADIDASKRVRIETRAEAVQRQHNEKRARQQAIDEALARDKAERQAQGEEKKRFAEEMRQRAKDARQEGIDAKREADRLEREQRATQRKEAARAAQWMNPFRVEADAARSRKSPDTPMSLEDATAIAADIIAPETPQESVRKNLNAAQAYRRIMADTGVDHKTAKKAYRAAYERVQDAKDAAREVEKIRSASTADTYTIDENGNRVKGPKQTVTLTEQQLQAALTRKARAEREAMHSKQDLASEFQRLQMTMPQRIMHNLVRGSRQVILSGIVGTAEKLGAFGAMEQIARPMRDLTGAVLRKIPGISTVARQAPREGGGFNVRAQAAGQAKYLRTIVETFTPGKSEVRRYLKTGHGEIDELFGKHDSLPPEVTELFGRLHGALKIPARLAEFEVSTRMRLEHAIRNGLDPTDPVVTLSAMEGAYLDANRAIMLADNMFSDAFTSAKQSLRNGRKGGKPHPYAAMTMEALAPITKVPANIVAEGFRHTPLATMKSVGEIALHGIRGTLSQLEPAEADRIMRNLKKGTMGTMLMALALAGGNVVQIGGHKKLGEKDDDLETKPETMRFFGVPVAKHLIHHPMFESLQSMQTFGRLMKQYGLKDAFLTTGEETLKHTPYINETGQMLEALRSDDKFMNFVGSFIRARVVPPDLQKGARVWDQPDEVENKGLQFAGLAPEERSTPRKPEGVMDVVKLGIPGLRQQVPVNEKAVETALKDSIVKTGKQEGIEAAGKKFQQAVEKGDLQESAATSLQKRIELSKAEQRIDHASLLDAIAHFNALPREKQTDAMLLMIDRKFNKTSPDSVRGKDHVRVRALADEFYEAHQPRIEQIEKRRNPN